MRSGAWALFWVVAAVVLVVAGAAWQASRDDVGPLQSGGNMTIGLESRGADELQVGGFIVENVADDVTILRVAPGADTECAPRISIWRQSLDNQTGAARGSVANTGAVPLTGEDATVPTGEKAAILFDLERNDCVAGQSSHFGPVTIEYDSGGRRYQGQYQFYFDITW